MLTKTSQVNMDEIDLLLSEFEKSLDEYNKMTSNKSKQIVLEEMLTVSRKISSYFSQSHTKYYLLNEIKLKSIEVFDHQIAFRTKQL